MKKSNNSKMGNEIYFKIAGQVDLDMLHIFVRRPSVNFKKNLLP
jgi:hypothetical protein